MKFDIKTFNSTLLLCVAIVGILSLSVVAMDAMKADTRQACIEQEGKTYLRITEATIGGEYCGDFKEVKEVLEQIQKLNGE